MKGFNEQGEWVDPLHKCPSCGFNTPMPEFANQHCPRCGAGQAGPKMPSEDRNTCSNCGAADQTGNFCTKCGKNPRVKV